MTLELDSLEKVTNWENYHAFMKERLNQLSGNPAPFLVSKKKVEFTEGKKSWKAHIVLVGSKGVAVSKTMVKAGVQFTEGSCTAAGKELAIRDVDATLLKEAARTLKRTRLGYGIPGVEADGEEGAEGPAGVASATMDATTDPALLQERLENLLKQIEKNAAVTSKETEPFIKQARARAKEAGTLIASDPTRAATLMQEGEEFARQALVGILEGGSPTEAVQIEAQRQELLAELEEAKKIKDPANDVILKQAEKGLEAALTAVGKKELPKAQALLDAVEQQLSLVVEGPDTADDPDLTVIGDWKAYRKFMKAQLKRVPKEGAPTFISREATTFSMDGKEFKGNVILFGPKARASSLALKREGMQFMEGTCKVDGTSLKVGGIKKKLLKGAGKTMIKLRLGKKIMPDGFLPPDDDETAEDAKDFHTGKAALDKQIKEVAEALVKLRDAIDAQKKAVPALKKAAQDKRKTADDLSEKARKASDDGKDKQQDWDDASKAITAADSAQFSAKSAEKESTRAETGLREMTERLHRIKDSADSASDKQAQLKKLKAEIAAKQLDTSIANIDVADPKAGKVIADQIEKRFGVKFKLNESKITGLDANGRQIFKDNDKKVDPKKEAETLKELYLTLSKAPVFPASHLKKLTVSLRPSNSRSEGGVYYGSDKSAEVTCRRPKESFDYGAQLNSAHAFPGGVDEDCKAANNDPVNYFDWATLHEVAHAVDAKYKFMDSKMSGAKYGNWIEHGTDVGPIAKAAVGKFGGAGDAKKLEAYATKVLKAKPGAGPAPTTPEETAIKNWVDAIRVTKGLWWDGGSSTSLAIGDRVYQEAYDFAGGWWNSYSLGARKQGIHGYQFRAPGEWFAELYAAYYSDKLKPSHPIVADLTKLEAPK